MTSTRHEFESLVLGILVLRKSLAKEPKLEPAILALMDRAGEISRDELMYWNGVRSAAETRADRDMADAQLAYWEQAQEWAS